jgi:hypothetical protein
MANIPPLIVALDIATGCRGPGTVSDKRLGSGARSSRQPISDNPTGAANYFEFSTLSTLLISNAKLLAGPFPKRDHASISNRQRRKEGAFSASESAGIEPTPDRSGRAGYARLNLSAAFPIILAVCHGPASQRTERVALSPSTQHWVGDKPCSLGGGRRGFDPRQLRPTKTCLLSTVGDLR